MTLRLLLFFAILVAKRSDKTFCNNRLCICLNLSIFDGLFSACFHQIDAVNLGELYDWIAIYIRFIFLRKFSANEIHGTWTDSIFVISSTGGDCIPNTIT